MKKVIVFALLLCLVLCASACSKGISAKHGEPINELAEAVVNGDVDDYMDAFEDDYVESLEEYYEIVSDNGLEGALSEALTFTKEYNKETYGKFTKITLTEVSKTVLDDFPENVVYSGEFVPDGKVEEILSVTVSYVIEGTTGSSEEKTATFTVYSVDGEYYLHPVHFFFVFQ